MMRDNITEFERSTVSWSALRPTLTKTQIREVVAYNLAWVAMLAPIAVFAIAGAINGG